MKVALICDWYHPRLGGIELHLQDLAARLTGAGHEVVVITPTPGLSMVDGIRVRRIDAPRAPRFGFLVTAGGVRAIGRALAQEKVDVAHCHVSIVSPAALGGASEAQRLGVPTVLTFHSVVPQTRLLARGVGLAMGAGRWNACFSAVSNRVARDVQPIAGAKSISILPNGIDAAFWRVERAPRQSETIELISVMRLNPKKRPMALVNALADGQLATRDVRLRIVGDGPERARVEQALERRGLGDRIQLLGRRTRGEIRALFAESDVFVLPTVRESFGLAALEARCAGLPVVAMAASGVAELIEHGREGLLARSDREFATHVARLSADTDLRGRIASNNRATVPACEWGYVIERHLALYRSAQA